MSESADRPEQPPPGRDDAAADDARAGDAGQADAPAAPTDAGEGHVGDGHADEAPPPGSPEATGAVQVTADAARGRYVVHVRYGALPTTGAATTTMAHLGRNDPVILRTNRGTELAVALTAPQPAAGGVGETVGHVLRKATGKDLEQQRQIEDELEPEELHFCRRKIAERGLRMRPSAVEHIFGGERMVFYFTAERRVDFRALVRDLAWHFHTRIELRQIGARDEARLLADFEHCGRPLCCKVFLRHLEPVTMRMAKLQRTTLDPQKISGRCGRLMCCLRFEELVYRELRRGLPHKGTRVHVAGRRGEVVATDILTQRATVRLGDGEVVRVPVRDLQPPSAEEPAAEGGGSDVSGRVKEGSSRGERPPTGATAEGRARAPSAPRGQRGDRSGGGGRSGGDRSSRQRSDTARGQKSRRRRSRDKPREEPREKPREKSGEKPREEPREKSGEKPGGSARDASRRATQETPRAGASTQPAAGSTDGARAEGGGPQNAEGGASSASGGPEQTGQPKRSRRDRRRRTQGRRRNRGRPKSSGGQPGGQPGGEPEAPREGGRDAGPEPPRGGEGP